MTPAQQKLRCAIYTRKSSDEGLEQGFNSLHAQREACEAYISSQTHEGWVLVPTAYDDGGFSGGSMERPALKHLLADVARGLVDTIVVYKVDRLTRSLPDFARIVDVFDKGGASFVSITQAFNTTTSMGRLTLNVLLSFAQFEREVTGERIRDKIAQSKAKGMWMGGNLPLGYDAGDHQLVVNEAEAETVRMIFTRYLALGSVYALQDELEARGVRSKGRVGRTGEAIPGAIFSRGALYHLLQNRHYRGEIKHKDQTFPGLHSPIVPAEVFERAQAMLADNRVNRRERVARSARAALVGLVFDADGAPYTPTFSLGRGGKTYRYYIAAATTSGTPRRLPADAFEDFVLDQVRRMSDRPEIELGDLRDWVRRIDVRPKGVHLVLDADLLFGLDHPELALGDLRARIAPGARAVMDPGRHSVRISLPVRMQFRGGQTWIAGVDSGHALRPPKVDRVLDRARREAHVVLGRLGASPLAPGAPVGVPTAPQNSYLTQLAKLALLAPDIQLEILTGRQPQGLRLKRLFSEDMPLAWDKQRRWVRTSG